MKKSKMKIIAIAFIVIFIASTAAGALLTSLRRAVETETETKIPSESIVDYELTAEQESLLKQSGKTIIKFRYGAACVECLKQKQFFESLVNSKEFAGQLILSEVKDSTLTSQMSVSIASYRGEEAVSNYTQNSVVSTLCDYVFQKPTFCLVKDVQ